MMGFFGFIRKLKPCLPARQTGMHFQCINFSL